MRLYRRDKRFAPRCRQRKLHLSARRAAIALATLLLIGSISTGFGANQDAPIYRFGPGDKLRIKVLDHPDMSGEVTIGQSGSISLPSVGRIPAAGREFDDLEGDIARRFRDSGIIDPQVSLEVAEYRPVYVVGDVKSPGRYPFAAGMTVLQAIALGGGLLMLSDEAVRVRLELLQAREAVETLELDYLAAIAKRSRLMAERDGIAEIRFPPAIVEQKTDTRIAEMMDNETRLFATRRAAISGEIAILEEQKGQSQEEMSFQGSQLEFIEKTNQLVETEKRDIGYLFGKGLATKTRLLELQRLQTDVQRNRVEVAAFMSRVREEVSRVALSIANLRNERLDRIVAELAEVEQDISKLEVRRRMGREVTTLHQMLSMQPVLRQALSGESFVITRDRGKGPEDMTVSDHSYVLPGDVVRVARFELQRSPTAFGASVRDLGSSVRADPAVAIGR